MQLKMCSIISLATVTGLFLTSTIVLAAPTAKRNYSNIFLLTDGFPDSSAA